MEKIIIGSDHAGFALKEKLKQYLRENGIEVKDAGPYTQERCDYPVFAAEVAGSVSKGKFKKGILICKSGIGNSIVANRFPRVRAALCFNEIVSALSREHNDSNILVLGSAFVSTAKAKKILDVWLNTEFQGGRHKKRLNIITKIEKEIKSIK